MATQGQRNGVASGSSSAASPTPPSSAPRAAPPLIPPPFYALVMPGLHRCSAVGLEDVVNNAWARRRQNGGRNGERRDDPEDAEEDEEDEEEEEADTGDDDDEDDDEDEDEGVRRSRSSNNRSPQGLGRQRPHSPSLDSLEKSRDGSLSSSNTTLSANSPHLMVPGQSSRPSQSSSSRLVSIHESSPVFSFLASLSLHTLIYLSPSLLPRALLKLAAELDLNLLQWDLSGPRIWRVRRAVREAASDGNDSGEREGLRRWVQSRRQRGRTNGGRQKGGENGLAASTEAERAVGLDDLITSSGNEGQRDINDRRHIEDSRSDEDGLDEEESEEESEEDIDFYDEDDVEDEGSSLEKLDLTGMCKATIEVALHRGCNGVLVCDSSGLAETSLVTGTLRRMQRLSFASICLEYRTFASGRFSASTGSSEGPWGGGSASGAGAHGAFDGAANAMATTNHTAKSATTNTATTAAHLKFIEMFPLETVELPDQWEQLVQWAADSLNRAEQRHAWTWEPEPVAVQAAS